MTIATMTTETSQARDCALATLAHITRLLRLRERCSAAGHCFWADAIQRQIDEMPLSVETRTGWSEVGGPGEAGEYRILLAWGGPAVQITGDLTSYGEPDSAALQFQGWGTGWQNVPADEIVLLDFARCFYFGQ